MSMCVYLYIYVFMHCMHCMHVCLVCVVCTVCVCARAHICARGVWHNIPSVHVVCECVSVCVCVCGGGVCVWYVWYLCVHVCGVCVYACV